MIGRLSWRLAAINVTAVTILLVIGVIAFGPVYDGFGYLIAGIGGIVAGVAIAGAGALRRWSIPMLVLVSFGAYMVLCTPLALRTDAVAGVVPTPATLRDGAVGIVTSWKDLLTAEVPVAGFDALLLVPLLTALITTVVAVSLVLRVRRPAFAAIPAVVMLMVAAGFGTYYAVAPLVLGSLFAVTAVLWLAWSRERERESPQMEADASADRARVSHRRPRRALTAAAMVVGAVVIAVGAQGAVTSGADRDVLRNHVDPPLDIHDYPSPLQTYRKYIRDDADTALFTVEDLPDGARVRLATVDYYDGVVYGVGASGQSGSGIFQRVGTSIPTETEGNAHSATFTVEALRGVWVPDIGYLTDISYDGARADELSRSTHYNRVTGVAVTTAALSEGDTYDVDFVLPPVPTREDLAGVDLAQLTVPAAQNIPEVAAEFAASESAGADSSSGRVIALAEALAGTGYFSHGLEDQPQSRSGHGSERIAALLTADQMIGDDEQYAVAMAVMARSMGMPARVVMGFYPESGEGGTFTATGDHLHVWVEVAFEDWGWVTFDPAPADDMTPPDEDEPPQREPKPQVLQPPPPPEDPAELPPSAPVEDDALGSQRDWGQSLLAVAVYVLAVGGVLAVLLGPFLVIALSKVRLRRRRKRAARTSDRVAGAWDEVLDRATDAGATLDVTATRPEHAAELEHRFGQVPVLALARQADAGVFGREEPTEEQTAQFWESIEQYLAEVRRADGWWARVRASLSVRSLASRRGVRRGSRQRSTRRDAT